GGAFGGGAGVELGAEGVIGAGAFEEAFDQRAEVEDGAGDEDGLGGGLKEGLGVGDEAGGGVGFPGVGGVEHEVGDAGAGGGVGLGGADVHAAVDLHGVDGHDGEG